MRKVRAKKEIRGVTVVSIKRVALPLLTQYNTINSNFRSEWFFASRHIRRCLHRRHLLTRTFCHTKRMHNGNHLDLQPSDEVISSARVAFQTRTVAQRLRAQFFLFLICRLCTRRASDWTNIPNAKLKIISNEKQLNTWHFFASLCCVVHQHRFLSPFPFAQQ